MLPKSICRHIEQLLSNFLCMVLLSDFILIKVARSEISQPKKVAGLGIRRISEWNKPSSLRCFWSTLKQLGLCYQR